MWHKGCLETCADAESIGEAGFNGLGRCFAHWTVPLVLEPGLHAAPVKSMPATQNVETLALNAGRHIAILPLPVSRTQRVTDHVHWVTIIEANVRVIGPLVQGILCVLGVLDTPGRFVPFTLHVPHHVQANSTLLTSVH